jgi:hypothetical protein
VRQVNELRQVNVRTGESGDGGLDPTTVLHFVELFNLFILFSTGCVMNYEAILLFHVYLK